ncbi:MAG: 1-acyl-sn-glycerol-3-phosphate acyltransferase [Bacilli bacterium]|nr:1-acyl-sn-glycerol-3-phosphate acyltransferase [Bacilli bacterium]
MKKYRSYSILKFILNPIFRLWYNPKIKNSHNIPKDGSIVIAGNHKHLYDQCLAIIATKRQIRYMAKKEYFDGKMAFFFKAVGCIPVNRKEKDPSAVSAALEVLNSDGALGIFPEGTRNKTDEFLLPFKFGAVSMAQKTNAYIVPFGLTGDYKFRSKNLMINFGKPFKVDNMTLEEANDKLYNEVKVLMEENLKTD